MYKHILVLGLVLVSSAKCNQDKPEGAECEWEGMKGTCVKSQKCLSSLDNSSESKAPVCSKNGEDQIICCTDCQLVEDISKAVIAEGGIFWKDGRKSRDYCLQTASQLCPATSSRQHNHHKMCCELVVDPSAETQAPEHAYQVLLGYGDKLESVRWSGSGAIISETYILTSGFYTEKRRGKLGFVALGVNNRTGSRDDWQIRAIKRVIPHPSYEERPRNYDVALLETVDPIQFDDKVQPTCLPFEGLNDDKGTVTTWEREHPDTPGQIVGGIRSIEVEKYLKDECLKDTNRYNIGRYNDTIHVCYGNRQDLWSSSRINSGNPLVVKDAISCLPSIAGLQSYWISGPSSMPTVYSRVSAFVPWIESVVWP